MASAGLVDLELSDEPAYRIGKQSGYTVIRSRMREASIVPIGRNHNSMAFRLYDSDGNLLNPADEKDGLKLSDFIVKPKIETKMSKKYLQMLNLADDAGDELIEAAVQKLAADKEAAETRVLSLSDNLTKANERLAAIELADTTARRTAFENELTDAFRDGRLSEKPEGDKPTPVRDRMLNLYDKDPEGTLELVKLLPKHTPANLNLGDRSGTEDAWAKRQKEIEEQSKK